MWILKRVHKLRKEGVERGQIWTAKELADVLGVSEYGTPFASVVARGSVFGAQFHPEKSSAHGLRMLANFAALATRAPA